MISVRTARVIAAAQSHLGFKEMPANWGQPVQQYLAKVGHKAPQPWCAAFVSWIGWHALLDPLTDKSEWPVPLTAGCKALGDWAAKEKLLVEEGAPGRIYVLHYTSFGRFAHTGIIIAPTGQPNEWYVIDGNSNNDGSREGYLVIFRKRVIDPKKGHRFINWEGAFHASTDV